MLRLVGLRCCPPWPFTTTVAVVSAFEDHRLGGARPCWGRSLDPLDLRAGFPDATRSCGSNSGLDASPLSPWLPTVCATGPVVRASSHGVVQRSPLRRIARQGVHSRKPPAGCPVACLLREENATSPPCSDLVVLHHLAGFLLPAGTRVLQRVSDPGVHHVSAGLARPADPCEPTGRAPPAPPRDVFLPFEAFPPRTAASGCPCEPPPAGSCQGRPGHPARLSPTSLPSRRCR
jgi:hypothetical protein